MRRRMRWHYRVVAAFRAPVPLGMFRSDGLRGVSHASRVAIGGIPVLFLGAAVPRGAGGPPRRLPRASVAPGSFSPPQCSALTPDFFTRHTLTGRRVRARPGSPADVPLLLPPFHHHRGPADRGRAASGPQGDPDKPALLPTTPRLSLKSEGERGVELLPRGPETVVPLPS